MTIGERIKQRRIQLGYSVDELAQKIGKNRATVYRYESNDIENFPTTVLEPLAKALETTPAYLMGWDSVADPSDANYTTTAVIKAKTQGEAALIFAKSLLECNGQPEKAATLTEMEAHEYLDALGMNNFVDLNAPENRGKTIDEISEELYKKRVIKFKTSQIINKLNQEPEKYFEILSYYDQLNALGKETATEHVRLLTLDKKYTSPNVQEFPTTVQEPPAKYSGLNAAHSRTDIEFTEEERAADEAMLDEDDDEW